MKKSIINLFNRLKAELMGFVKMVESFEKKDLYFIANRFKRKNQFPSLFQAKALRCFQQGEP